MENSTDLAVCASIYIPGNYIESDELPVVEGGSIDQCHVKWKEGLKGTKRKMFKNNVQGKDERTVKGNSETPVM
jgi:hypothetical protein